jgi:DNA-binding transcriptional ArsR family regulator
MPKGTWKRYHWSAEQKAEMVRLYVEDEYSFGDIARKFGTSQETIRYHLAKVKTVVRRRGMQTKRARAKISGAKHHGWKGGRWEHHGGYVFKLVPDHPYAKDGYVAEHRWVVEDYLRRYDPDHEALDENKRLRRDWVVHHINGKKNDNRIENLEPLRRGSHSSWLHYQEEMRALKIELSRLRRILEEHGIDPAI